MMSSDANSRLARSSQDDDDLAKLAVIVTLAAGVPWALIGITWNVLLLRVWPWLLAYGGLYALGMRLRRPVTSNRRLISCIVGAGIMLLVGLYWVFVLPSGGTSDYFPPSTLVTSLTWVGASLIAAGYVLAYLGRGRFTLLMVEASLLTWLFGPALPWIGERP